MTLLPKFFAVSLLLAVAPGPDILFVLAQSVERGAAAGAMVTLGLCTGLCVHVLLAALGFAAVIGRYPRAFKAVTLFGAAYLCCLAVMSWREAPVVQIGGGAPCAGDIGFLRLYARGIVMNLCNPKVILFFLALVPGYVDAKRGRTVLQFVVLGAVFAAAVLIVFNAVSLAGGAVSRHLAGQPGAMPRLRYFSSIVMFGIAVWIAWTNLRHDRAAGKADGAA